MDVFRLPNLFRRPPPPPPPLTFAVPFDLSVCSVRMIAGFCVGQALIGVLLRFVFGRRRFEANAMGGVKKEGEGSYLADILAYNVLATVYALGAATIGAVAWFDGTASAIGGSAPERLYSRCEAFVALGTLTASYEVYNTLCVIYLKEYRNVAFVGHHVTTLFLALHAFFPGGGSFLHYCAPRRRRAPCLSRCLAPLSSP